MTKRNIIWATAFANAMHDFMNEVLVPPFHVSNVDIWRRQQAQKIADKVVFEYDQLAVDLARGQGGEDVQSGV